jgi:hypothetical protein
LSRLTADEPGAGEGRDIGPGHEGVNSEIEVDWLVDGD